MEPPTSKVLVKVGEQYVRYKRYPSGTCYHDVTVPAVISVLENALDTSRRLRLFYGNVNTGSDWCETGDIIGRVYQTAGTAIKLPFIAYRKPTVGAVILDHCIVRITDAKTRQELYKHPTYHLPLLRIRGNCVDLAYGPLNVTHTFRNSVLAIRYVDFLYGRRMNL